MEDNLDLAEENVVLGDEEEEIAEANDGTYATIRFLDTDDSLIDSASAEAGHEIVMPNDPVKFGYDFEGWYTSKEYTTRFTGGTVNNNADVYAKWTAKKVDITYNVNNADSTAGNTVTWTVEADFGATPAKPDDPIRKDGTKVFRFDGWYTSEAEADKALAARSADALFHFTDYTENSQPKKANVITKTLLGIGGDWPAVKPTATLYAGWTEVLVANFYKSAEDYAAKATPFKTVKIAKDADETKQQVEAFAAPTVDGSNFLYWKVVSDGAMEGYELVLKGKTAYAGADKPTNHQNYITIDVDVVAQWKPITYQIEFKGLDGAQVSKDDDTAYAPYTTDYADGKLTIKWGEKMTKPADPYKDNMLFLGWFEDQTTTTPYDFSAPVTANGSIYARFVDAKNVTVKYIKKTTNKDTGVVSYAEAAVPGDKAAIAVQYNTAMQKPADPTLANAEFINWYADDKGETLFDFSQKILTDTVTVYALFNGDDITTYAVNFKYRKFASDGTSSLADLDTQYVVAGKKAVAPTTPVQDGYVFDDWYLSNTGTEKFSFDTPINSDYPTIRAEYNVKKYNVTFDTNGGSAVASQEVAYGANPTKPTNINTTTKLYPTEKDGYTFAGWFLDKNGTGTRLDDPLHDDYWATYTKIKQDTTIYAKWTPHTYKVVLEYQGSGVMKDATHEKDDVEIAPITAGKNLADYAKANEPSKAGFVFLGWYHGSTKVDLTTTPMSDSLLDITTKVYAEPGAGPTYSAANTITLNPKFSKISCTVTFESNGGTPVNSVTVEAGNTITKPDDPTKDGFTLAGWYTDKELTKEYTFKVLDPANPTGAPLVAGDPITKSMTLYAKYKDAEYTVKFAMSLASGVINVPDNQTVKFGGTATKPTTDPTYTGAGNYLFDGWYADPSYQTPFNFDGAITRDTTVYGNMARAYKVTLMDTSTVAAGVQFLENEIKFPLVKAETKATNPGAAPNREGKKFVGWYTDATLKTPFDFEATTISSDTVKAFAKYEKATTVQVTLNMGDAELQNGRATVTNATYVSAGVYKLYAVKGETVAAPTVKKDGYTFRGFFAEGSATAFDFANTPVNDALTLTGQWQINSYTVSFNTDGGTSVASQIIEYNKTVALPTEPTKTGHTFGGWFANKALTEPFVFTGANVYAKTKDTAPVAGKTYYTEAGTIYSAVDTPNVEAIGTYYELLPATAIIKDTTVYAKFTVNTYIVNFYKTAANGANETATVNYNKPIPEGSIPTSKIADKAISGWYTDAQLTKPFDLSTPITRGGIVLYPKYLTAVVIEGKLDSWAYDKKTDHKPTYTVTSKIATDVPPTETVEYKAKADPDTAYSPTVPTAVGEYICRISVAESNKTAAAKKEIEFAITKAPLTVEWPQNTALPFTGAEQVLTPTLKGMLEGETVEPIMEGKGTKIGEYTAKVTLPENCNYVIATTAVDTMKYTIVENTTAPTDADVKFDATTGLPTAVVLKNADGSTTEIPVAGSDYFTVETKDNGDGTTTVTISPKAGSGYTFTPITKTVEQLLPAATKITSITVGKKKATVKWKVIQNAEGYQIQYGLKKSEAAKMDPPKKFTGAKATIKKLKKGKKYYFRIRTYKTVNGKTEYSAWSKWKKSKKIK